jgi:DNA processing protein
MGGNNLSAWLAFNRAELPPRIAQQLLARFSSPEKIFSASPADLAAAAKLTPGMLRRLEAQKSETAFARDQAALAKLGAGVLTCQDVGYPALLGQIYDPPVMLFVRGEIREQDGNAVAIVGSRRCSPYGRLTAHRLARELAQRRITIVSGLATGIDAAAHEGALEAGGRTIGVMGCGLEVPYPREHGELKDRIARQGAVVSEAPLGAAPTPSRFPVRNRIISGLSLGVVVVEAPEKSGAMITAHLAADQGREVFAVPGNFNSAYSRGCHQLIREGAKLVDEVEHIMEELNFAPGASPAAPPAEAAPVLPNLSPDEARLLAGLSLQQRYMDDLIAETGLPSSQVSAGLMLLELKGLVKRLPGNLFVRVK